MKKIVDFVRSFRDPTRRLRFLLFAGTSVVTTVGGWIIIRLLATLGWNIDIANIVQAIWSIAVAFYLNNRFAWGDRKWIPLIVKMKLYAISKIVTVSFNAICFRVLLLVSPFVILWVLQPLGAPLLKWYLSHADEYAQLVAYLGSTAIIMFVNWILYDQTVFATRSLKELQHTHPRIYKWMIARYIINFRKE